MSMRVSMIMSMSMSIDHEYEKEKGFMNVSQECWFDHEKLDVYRETIAFIAWLSALLEGAVKLGDVKDHLDSASTSIALNIAEGNGKYSVKDRCRFFDTASGSALECAAGLDILVAKAKLTRDQIHPVKSTSKESSECSWAC